MVNSVVAHATEEEDPEREGGVHEVRAREAAAREGPGEVAHGKCERAP